MYAQRKAPYAPRTHAGRAGYRPAMVRARVGLAMRRGMHFGDLPDAEAVLRSHGLSLAPMSVGEAGLNPGGTLVLPTAQPADIDSGALKGVVVPAGAADADGAAALEDVVVRAHAKGAPVLAFGDGVVIVLRALGRPSDGFADLAAVLVLGDEVRPVNDAEALGRAAGEVR